VMRIGDSEVQQEELAKEPRYYWIHKHMRVSASYYSSTDPHIPHTSFRVSSLPSTPPSHQFHPPSDASEAIKPKHPLCPFQASFLIYRRRRTADATRDSLLSFPPAPFAPPRSLQILRRRGESGVGACLEDHRLGGS